MRPHSISSTQSQNLANGVELTITRGGFIRQIGTGGMLGDAGSWTRLTWLHASGSTGLVRIRCKHQSIRCLSWPVRRILTKWLTIGPEKV